MVNPWTEKNRNEGYFKKEIAWYNANANSPQTTADIRSGLQFLTEIPDDLSNDQINRILKTQIIDKLKDNLQHEKKQRTHSETKEYFEPYLKKYIDLGLNTTNTPLLKLKAFQGLRNPPAFYRGDLNQKERERARGRQQSTTISY